MPYFQFNGLVILEEFLHKLYLEYQTEIVGVIIGLTFLTSANASNLNQV